MVVLPVVFMLPLAESIDGFFAVADVVESCGEDDMCLGDGTSESGDVGLNDVLFDIPVCKVLLLGRIFDLDIGCIGDVVVVVAVVMVLFFKSSMESGDNKSKTLSWWLPVEDRLRWCWPCCDWWVFAGEEFEDDKVWLNSACILDNWVLLFDLRNCKFSILGCKFNNFLAEWNKSTMEGAVSNEDAVDTVLFVLFVWLVEGKEDDGICLLLWGEERWENCVLNE